MAVHCSWWQSSFVHSCVRGGVLGVLEIWVAFRYSLRTSRKCGGCCWPIRDGILTSGIGNGWSSGPKTSLTSYRYFCRYIYFLSDFRFWSAFCFRNSVLHHDLPVRMTSWPWWRPVLHQDGLKRASGQFPGALGQNPTRRTDQGDLRYGWNWIPCQLPANSPNVFLLLT